MQVCVNGADLGFAEDAKTNRLRIDKRTDPVDGRFGTRV